MLCCRDKRFEKTPFTITAAIIPLLWRGGKNSKNF